LDLVSLGDELFGSYVDASIQQTKILYDTYYWIWTSEIIENPTADRMKEILYWGKPIVAPFAWKLLWNIYFSNWWPRYHMLVIVWYDQGWFYTHDVGTKHWELYRYSDAVLMNAMHDLVPKWQGDIQKWDKRVLIFNQ